MPNHVDQVLDQRKHRLTPRQRRTYLATSVVGHVVLTVAFLGLPALFAEPPRKIESIAVTVVPPKALGDPNPAPPVPPKTEPEKPPPETPPTPPPPPPAPAPKPKPERTTVPPPETKPRTQPQQSQPPPPAAPDPGPPRPQRRVGSVFGNPLGASTSAATLGVEDPNFTYGYYLDRVVNQISSNWTRPIVGGDIENAILYFRILPDGKITDLRIKESSGSDSFDSAALRAVNASVPLPPLPKGYKKDFLGINLIVK